MELIERSFVGTGLAGDEPLLLFERLNSFGDAELLGELGAIARELGWRLRELERDTLLRASSLPADDARLVQKMIARLKFSENE